MVWKRKQIRYKKDKGDCFICTSHGLKDRYPDFRHPKTKKCVKISRYVWEQKHGKIPEGISVCHKCDNPRCINPDHLFLGTQLDNMRDMWQKGRKKVKIDNNDVRKIMMDKRSHEKIARDYNIARSYVSQIKENKIRKDIIRQAEPLKKIIGTMGEENPMAKLTKEKVIEIRFLYGLLKHSGITQRDLANEFKTSITNIANICSYRRWKHV